MIKEADENFFSTREAADKLSLSVGTVQKLVEDGVLKAWKTSGGHRRIIGSSLEEFYHKHRPGLPDKHDKRLSILVVEDDLTTRELYRITISGWNKPVDLEIVENGLSGLLQIARNPPDILISDLKMNGVNGFEMINTLRKDNIFNMMDIIVVSGLSETEIAEMGGLPKGVTVFPKPIPFLEIYGYVNAKLAALERHL